MRIRIVLISLVLAFLFIQLGAAQQDKGTITGTVLDPSGALLANAKVEFRNPGTGETRSTTSGGSGQSVFTPLAVGTYEVTVTGPGFETEVKKGLELKVQQTLDLKFDLRVGSATRVIEVTDTVPPLQASYASVGQVIDTRKIVNLPLNGRDVYQLVQLVPGAVVGPDGSPAISGQPEQYQFYAMDGVDNSNYQGNLQSGHAWNLSPSPDAVQEFKVQTNDYSAEFGQSAGGVVNVILKSGTNTPHGSLYEFIRNDVFDARNFFATSRPPYKQNQFGGSIGGPVIIPKLFNGRNRLFFFGDYEGFRSRKGTTENVFLPDAAYRSGDFRSLLTWQTFTDPCTGGMYDTGQLFDPNTTHQLNCTGGGTGFARTPVSYNGQANAVNPAEVVVPARNTAALLPTPNAGLTVNLGLRCEFGGTLGEGHDRVTNFDPTNGYLQIPKSRQNQPPYVPAGLPVEYIHSDTLYRNSWPNFGPRVGAAYQITPSTVIRSGFGIFDSNPYPPGTASFPLNLPWANSVNETTPATGPIDPVTHQQVGSVTSIVSGFPAGYLNQVLAPPTIYGYDSKPLYPYTIGWNAAVQHELGWGTVLEAAYSASAGVHVITGLDLNQPTPTADPNSNPQSRRPYPLYGPIALEQTGGHSSYESLQMKLEKRFSNGLTFLSAFTWGHSIDDSSLCFALGNDGGHGDCLRDSRDRRLDRANSSLDIRRRWAFTFLYDLRSDTGSGSDLRGARS